MKTKVCETCFTSSFKWDPESEGLNAEEYAERVQLEIVPDEECEWCAEYDED